MKLVINSYDSYKFSELHRITQWRDGCIYKTESEGFISDTDKEKYPADLYVLTSISTEMTRGRFCTLDPFIS